MECEASPDERCHFAALRPRSRSVRPLLCVAAMALGACLLCAQARGATPWPSLEFRVDFSRPTPLTSPAQATPPVLPDRDRATVMPQSEGEATGSPDDRMIAFDALSMFFERSLADAAMALQSAGYEPPNLPLFRDSDGSTYYKVHVYDFSQERDLSDANGVYHSEVNCDDPGISAGNWFGIAAEDFIPLTSSQEAFLYVVLAHELVHAVQASYAASADALSGCSAETEDYKTVVEGTADALAYLLARRHWPKYYLEFHRETSFTASSGEELDVLHMNAGTGFMDSDLVGLRLYDRPFLDLSTSAAADRRLAPYNTSSFWFNLLDRYGIGFVDHLLRRPLRHGDLPSLLEWLDDALRSYQPALDGLYIVFPHFVAEFASQAGSRFPLEELPGYSSGQDLLLDPGGGSPPASPPAGDDEWRRHWIEQALGHCQSVTLTPGQGGAAEVRFALPRLSAACLDIRWEGFHRNFELYLEAEHTSLRLIDQVNVGLVYQRVGGETQDCYSAVRPHYAEPLWSCVHEKPFLTNGAQPLSYTRRWSEPGNFLRGEGRRFMAIGNVARNARTTGAFTHEDPLVLRVGIAEAEADDSRVYDPPFSAFKGMPSLASGMGGFDAEAQYGITTTPTPATMLLNFSLPIADSDEAYGVSWMGETPSLGYRGPFTGTVTAPQKSGAQSVVSSMLCQRHRDGVVGRILRFDRDQLSIEIDADLCEIRVPPPADGNFPIVDRVRARLHLPFGWQYDPASAPADIVTPGMQVFIDRHARKVPRVLSDSWHDPGPGPDETGAGNDPPGTGSPGASGGGSGAGASGASGASVLQGAPCACSCEELAAFDEASETSKAAGDDRATMALAREMMSCMAQCQRPYLLCRAGFSP